MLMWFSLQHGGVREVLPGKGSKRNPAFVMRVSDDETENEECSSDSSDVESRALVVGTRFACDNDFRFELISLSFLYLG